MPTPLSTGNSMQAAMTTRALTAMKKAVDHG